MTTGLDAKKGGEAAMKIRPRVFASLHAELISQLTGKTKPSIHNYFSRRKMPLWDTAVVVAYLKTHFTILPKDTMNNIDNNVEENLNADGAAEAEANAQGEAEAEAEAQATQDENDTTATDAGSEVEKTEDATETDVTPEPVAETPADEAVENTADMPSETAEEVPAAETA